MYNIRFQHAMAFCGVHLLDDKPVRWKVEDSYGDKEKINGYYIMNDNFFDEFVSSVLLNFLTFSTNKYCSISLYILSLKSIYLVRYPVYFLY